MKKVKKWKNAPMGICEGTDKCRKKMYESINAVCSKKKNFFNVLNEGTEKCIHGNLKGDRHVRIKKMKG